MRRGCDGASSRDVASACSTLQVCLAARVERDAAVAFTASFQHTAPSPEEQRAGGAATRTRRVGRETSSHKFALAQLF